MSYPPKGYTPGEFRTRIGHGDQRFQAAVEQALTWQIQQRSGIRVRVDDVPPPDETAYVPVVFDSTGAPVPHREPRDATELRYSADGVALLSAGTTATLTLRFLGVPFHAPARVVYLIDEPGRRGFVIGTMRGHPLSGEESFVIEQTDDGAVWINVRMFWRPASAWWALVRPLLVLLQRRYTARYLRALQAATDAAVSTSSTELATSDAAEPAAPETVEAGHEPWRASQPPVANRLTGGDPVAPLVLPERDESSRDDVPAGEVPIEPALDEVVVQPDAVAADDVTSFEVPVVALDSIPASAPDPGDLLTEELQTPMPAVPQAIDAESDASTDTDAEARPVTGSAIDDRPAVEPRPALGEGPVVDPASDGDVSADGDAAEPQPDAAAAPAPAPPSAPFVERLQTSQLNLLGRPRDRPLLDGLPSLRRAAADAPAESAPSASAADDSAADAENRVPRNELDD